MLVEGNYSSNKISVVDVTFCFSHFWKRTVNLFFFF